MSKPTVGTIGLGIMGSAMSANLLKDGWTVIGYDVLERCVKAHVKGGGVAAASPREVAEKAEVVITSLPSAEAFETVVGGGDNGILAAGGAPIVIETSTLGLEVKQRGHDTLKQAGIEMLDCPLSGTGAQARTKDLAVYASGDRSCYERCRPVFEGFARSSHHVGDFGNGSKMKFVANLLVAIHNAAAAEALVLGMKAGLDPRDIYDVIRDGAGSSRMFEIRGPMMVDNDYDNATMKVSVWQKDMQIISDFARTIGCPTPLFSSTAPLYTAAMSQGHDARDTASVCAVLEDMAGLPKRR
jgi:3-hydroxyisobutyrate dehydrogenase-like beta-hydroxyacid dehydrogenase